jgi:thiamine-phosphate pyrophosphorylase
MLMTLKRQSSPKRKLLAAARTARSHLPGGLPPVLFLTDPSRTPDPLATAKRLPAGWGVIYRHFGAADAAAMASALARVCRERGLCFLIASDPQLAMTTGADGVHWPHAKAAASRKWQSRFALMTASAHSPEELRALAGYPVDAALVSTVFASYSPSARAPLGALRLRTLARASAYPVFALGGITAENAAQLASFTGIAAVDALTQVF